jgi:hypothetical protein
MTSWYENYLFLAAVIAQFIGIGAMWGSLKTGVKQISEKTTENTKEIRAIQSTLHNGFSDRQARIETKVTAIGKQLEHFEDLPLKVASLEASYSAIQAAKRDVRD